VRGQGTARRSRPSGARGPGRGRWSTPIWVRRARSSSARGVHEARGARLPVLLGASAQSCSAFPIGSTFGSSLGGISPRRHLSPELESAPEGGPLAGKSAAPYVTISGPRATAPAAPSPTPGGGGVSSRGHRTCRHRHATPTPAITATPPGARATATPTAVIDAHSHRPSSDDCLDSQVRAADGDRGGPRPSHRRSPPGSTRDPAGVRRPRRGARPASLALAILVRPNAQGIDDSSASPVFSVASGSMTPAINTADLIVDNSVTSARPHSPRRPDHQLPRVMQPAPTPVITHRIVAVLPGAAVAYRTKGDANTLRTSAPWPRGLRSWAVYTARRSLRRLTYLHPAPPLTFWC